MKMAVSRTTVVFVAGFINGVCLAGPRSDEIKLCVEEILIRNQGCTDFVAVESAKKVDSRETTDEAHVIAEVSLRVQKPIYADFTPAMENCTGTTWTLPLKPGQATSGPNVPIFPQREPLEVGQQLIIRKEFTFQKWQSGWRCATDSMAPIVSGEVRALVSLVGFLPAYVKVHLTGAEETPPVTTTATGTGTITVAGDKSVSGTIKTTGIDGTVAHIHLGGPGVAGPPIFTLTKGADGEWSVPAGSVLTDSLLASFKAGYLYVNVHSAAHKPGEIRAQLKP